MATKRIFVIGSGPAGVSAAAALLNRGLQVTMLDAGRTLEQDLQDDVASMRAKRSLSPEDRAKLKRNIKAGISGVDEKKIFGSSYANSPSGSLKIEKHNARFYVSFAKGGLSNLWGRLVMPICREDMKDWPLSAEELEKYYRKVLEYLPLSGQDDFLSKLLPLYSDCAKPHPLSGQASKLDRRIQRNLESLEKDGFCFGPSRLAACFDGSMKDTSECIRCGLCLYGCIFDNLYSSARTVDHLLKDDNFNYVSGYIVDHVREKDGQLAISAYEDSPSAQQRTFMADEVFLAAGSLASSRIVLKSKAMYNTPIKFQISDFYIFPTITLGSHPNVTDEELHTCCQYFILLDDKAVDTRIVNLQVYTYNDYYHQVYKKLAGRAYPMLKGLINFFLDRFVVVFLYLHSENSAHFELTLKDDDTLEVVGKTSPQSRKIAARVKRKLWRTFTKIGLLPIPFVSGEQQVGYSMHYGGSLPMAETAEGLKTDTFGNVDGIPGLHVVDSAVFPTIPATAPTFAIMANAYRIGAEVDI